ncbi:MAG: hypothetical protein ABIF18_02280 [archaeon]
MDYGSSERRKTKKDLKRKRLARGYKRGGQFRTHEVSETGEEKGEKNKKSKKKLRKY